MAKSEDDVTKSGDKVAKSEDDVTKSGDEVAKSRDELALEKSWLSLKMM